MLPVILTAFIGLVVCLPSANDPLLGGSIDRQIRPSSSSELHSRENSVTVDEKISGIPDDPEPEPGLITRSYKGHPQFNYGAAFNTVQGGYNISLHGICPYTVVGDIAAPNGTLITNATFSELYDLTNIPARQLHNYTLTRALAVQKSLNDSLSEVICSSAGPNRDLLFRFSPNDIEGFYEAYVIGSLGVFFIGWGGLYLGIAKTGPASNNGTYNHQALVLATTGAVEFMFVTMVVRLQTKGFLSRSEAVVLNFFIFIAEQVGKAFTLVWGQTCTTASAFGSAIVQLVGEPLTRLQTFEPRSLGTPGVGSTIDLVGLDQSHSGSGGVDACPV